MCGKGKNNKSETFASKTHHAIQIPVDFTKQKSCQVSVQTSPYISCFHLHLQTSSKFPAGWGAPGSAVGMNPPPAEPAAAQH